MAGAPRTPDGKINMTGPVPRLNGKPDLSGIWQVQAEPRAPGGLFGLGESPNSKYFRDILSDFKPDERPLTPAGAELLRQHGQPGAFNPTLNCLPDGVPHGDLLPEPFKIIHSPGVIVMLYEVETTFRQIFTDGRKLPADPSPTWQGYSVGRWEGDTLVIDTAGFNDLGWLDARGTGHSDGDARRGALPPPRLRPPGAHHHHHRPEDLHQADHLQRRRGAAARHRSVRALLPRKRKGRRTPSGASAEVIFAHGRGLLYSTAERA